LGHPVLDGSADFPREGAILGVVWAIQKDWPFACKRDHSTNNNIMQQKGSFSMQGKGKQESGKFSAQATQPIGK